MSLTSPKFSHRFKKERLDSELADFEAQTGWKLRVLTQYDRTPGLAVRDFWDLDDRSILLVADTRGGNLLNFNVGDTAYRVLQRTFLGRVTNPFWQSILCS